MDKNAIKKYAVWARRELISRVAQKALQYGIEKDSMVPATADSVNGHVLSAGEKKQRQALIAQIDEKGFEQVMEEVAYTWFNRFSALRFMEVNGYLPSHVRVFTDDENNFKPQIITEAIHLELDGLDMEKVYALKEADKTEELFKYLLIVQCNALNSILPGMFQRIEDYTELLLPDNLLREGSVVEQMIAMIPEEDWRDQIQIIGWLYQYYNAEKKDEVFAALKKNVKITKENIPAATQLFTPDWIVRYMVENSLGRLWLEGHPNDELKSNWKYYLDEAEQEQDVQVQLAEIRKEYAGMNPEQIKCIDPCCGSGHIIAYLFDVLMQIYESYGYTSRDAVASIVKNNLYGLDIDDRAAQLANFAVMMKARQYDRRFFSRGIQPMVYAIQESNGINRRQLQYFGGGLSPIEKNSALNQMNGLLDELTDAKEYGSILSVDSCDWDLLRRFAENIDYDGQMSLDAIGVDATQIKLLELLHVGEVLASKYDVAITNPPYMSLKGMSQRQFDYVMKKHPITKSDMYGVFMQICLERFCKATGFVSMITQHVWMFTSGFEKFRRSLLSNYTISSLVHLGTRAFEEISGEVVQTCAFVFSKHYLPKYQSKFVRLVDENSAAQKEEAYLNGVHRFDKNANSFGVVPGLPICYWLGNDIFEVYKKYPLIGDVSSTRQGLKTSDDKRFIRFFYEVDASKIACYVHSIDEAAESDKKWFWLNKGGQIKWYGNNIYLINWENDGKEVKDYATKIAGSYSKNITAIDAYFKECVSWPQISMSHPSFRHIPTGYIFASAGPSLFTNSPNHKWYVLGLLNCCVTQNLLDAINPTINFGVSDILKIPFVYSEEYSKSVCDLVQDSVELSKDDYDSFETSWDFKRNPLIRYALCGNTSTTKRGILVSQCVNSWKQECEDRFYKIKGNEESLNRIFLEIYGLGESICGDVNEADVDIHKADVSRDIRELISYSVGCMFGRYSLDVGGLAYAGGEWDASKYVTFPADKDSIIPICDDEYFADDIVGRFVKFIEVVYGSETLDENLKFIADALGGKGQPKEVIRNYFMNDFYVDHCKMYQKRPIYWLFDSGKKNGFKALIYMHRYREDTIARIRTDYVHEQQARYRTALADLEQRIAGASAGERVKLNKKLKQLQEQAAEIHAYEEKIHHLADQMIRIDLDDGVKVNYAKFQDVLAKIK